MATNAHAIEHEDGLNVSANFSEIDCPGARSGHFKNLILDIGGVLLQPNLDVNYGTAVPPQQFKRMLRSHTWFEYQMGKLSAEAVYHQLSVQKGFAAQDIRNLARKARESLLPITEMIVTVVRLSEESKLRLFVMTNCPTEDFNYLQEAFPEIFERFEKTFTSSASGMRKPNPDFFRHVIQETGIIPSETLFIDDVLANVLTAELLGFTAIQADPEAIEGTVNQLVFSLRTEEERLSAAGNYLERTRGVPKSLSLTSEGIRVPVHFDHYLIANVLNNEKFLPMTSAPKSGIFNFFPNEEIKKAPRDLDKNSSAHHNLPDDLDTTSIALSSLYKFSLVDMPTINRALDAMEKCVSKEGIFHIYFDSLRPRVDHVALTNILYLFHLAGRTQVTKETEEYIFNILSNRAYLRGSLYYRNPETFLYHLSRLVYGFKEHFEKAGFTHLLARRLTERLGMEGDALVLAMRILACAKSGFSMANLWRERDRLARMQNEDGSWDVYPYYTYNDPKCWFGNEALTTAFAVSALAVR